MNQSDLSVDKKKILESKFNLVVYVANFLTLDLTVKSANRSYMLGNFLL